MCFGVATQADGPDCRPVFRMGEGIRRKTRVGGKHKPRNQALCAQHDFRSETRETNVTHDARDNRAFRENLSMATSGGVCFLFGMIAAVAAINSEGQHRVQSTNRGSFEVLSTGPSNGDVNPHTVAFRDVAHKSDDRGGAAVAVGADLMSPRSRRASSLATSSGPSDRVARRRSRGNGLKEHIFGDHSENFKTFRER